VPPVATPSTELARELADLLAALLTRAAVIAQHDRRAVRPLASALNEVRVAASRVARRYGLALPVVPPPDAARAGQLIRAHVPLLRDLVGALLDEDLAARTARALETLLAHRATVAAELRGRESAS
jgi:hypothetical protein